MGRVLMDANSEEEKIISERVYNAFMDDNCQSIGDYYKAAAKIDEEFKKDKRFSQRFMDVFLKNYATEEQINKYIFKKREMNSRTPEFVLFCDKLFELPEARRNEYVLSSKKNLSTVIDMLNKYKRRNSDYSLKVDEFIVQYKKFFKEYSELEKEKNMLIDYNECLAFFNRMVDLGFYSIIQYCDYLYGPGFNSKNGDSIINSKKRKIQKYDQIYGKNNWNNIMNRLEDNREKSYLILKDKIDYFNVKLRENNSSFNIIDYYLIVGISFKDYQNICSGFLSSRDMLNFKNFVNRYKRVSWDTSRFERVDVKISEDEKMMLYSFLRENSIPECYYVYLVDKYINGDLDNCINVGKYNVDEKKYVLK